MLARSHRGILAAPGTAFIIAALIASGCSQGRKVAQPQPSFPELTGEWDNIVQVTDTHGKPGCHVRAWSVVFRADGSYADSIFSHSEDDLSLSDSTRMCTPILMTSDQGAWSVASPGRLTLPGWSSPLTYELHGDSLTIYVNHLPVIFMKRS